MFFFWARRRGKGLGGPSWAWGARVFWPRSLGGFGQVWCLLSVSVILIVAHHNLTLQCLSGHKTHKSPPPVQGGRATAAEIRPPRPKFGDHWSVSMEPKNHPPISAETRFEIRPRCRPGLEPCPWISGDFSIIRALWSVRSISQSQRRIVRETSLAAR